MTAILTKHKILVLCCVLVTVLAVAVGVILLTLHSTKNTNTTPTTTTAMEPTVVISNVTVEAGCGSIPLTLFQMDPAVEIAFQTDISTLDLTKVGTHTILLSSLGKTYSSTLEVIDTTAPTATAADQETYIGDALAAEAFVTDIRDFSEVTVSFATQPDVSKEGIQTVQVLLTDAYQNSTTITAQLSVVPDVEAPVFGKLKKITIELGESVSYKSGVTVTDNRDGSITTYVIDKSGVDTTQPGTYIIIYTATDRCGNSVTAERTLVIEPKPVITKELVDEQIEKLLSDITTDSMSVTKKFETAYNYIRKNVTYKNIVEEDFYTAAYYAIKKKRGDCYNYYAAIACICDYLGIENMMITRVPTSDTRHFWSLVNTGTGWYHVDACPTVLKYNKRCFMWTDKQCADYSESRTDGRTDYYAFDPTLYPERATEPYSG